MTVLKSLVLAAAVMTFTASAGLARAEEVAGGTKKEAFREKMKERGEAAFIESDTDKNGTLSLDEFLKRHKDKFLEIDADKNGSLTREEMKAYGGKMHEARKERREERKMDVQESKPE